MKYPPSVMVKDTMRIAGSASTRITSALLPGGKKSIMAPVTRAVLLVGRLLHDRAQEVLLFQQLPHALVRRQHTGADDRPVVIGTGLEQRVQIHCLVCTVKIADAEVQDTGRQCRAIIGRYKCRCGNPVEIPGTKLCGHQRPQECDC